MSSNRLSPACAVINTTLVASASVRSRARFSTKRRNCHLVPGSMRWSAGRTEPWPITRYRCPIGNDPDDSQRPSRGVAIAADTHGNTRQNMLNDTYASADIGGPADVRRHSTWCGARPGLSVSETKGPTMSTPIVG